MNNGQQSNPVDAYVFGVRPGNRHHRGHHLYYPSGTAASYFAWPIPWSPREVDGALCERPEVIGKRWLHHRDGWTALAQWDRSGDDRPGSNTVFFFRGTYTEAEAIALAEKHFTAWRERMRGKRL